MTAKKKTAKKTGKTLAKQGRFNGPVGRLLGGEGVASPYPAKAFPEALATFDAALKKVVDARTILDLIPGAGMQVHDEVVAHRAQVLANLMSEVSMAAHTLNAAAYAKAQS